MSEDLPRPDGPEIRTLKPGTTRLLLLVAFLTALAASYWAADTVLRARNDPEWQRQLEDIQRTLSAPDTTTAPHR